MKNIFLKFVQYKLTVHHQYAATLLLLYICFYDHANFRFLLANFLSNPFFPGPDFYDATARNDELQQKRERNAKRVKNTHTRRTQAKLAKGVIKNSSTKICRFIFSLTGSSALLPNRVPLWATCWKSA